jgi:hypothetical protein
MENLLPDLLVSALLVLPCGLIAVLVAGKWKLSVLPFAALLLVLVATGLVTRLPLSPLFVGLEDAGYYLNWASEIVRAWKSGEPWTDGIWPGKGVWSLVIALLSFFPGELFISLIVLNSVVFSFSALLLQRATHLLFGAKPTWLFVLLMATNPGVLLYGPSPHRESIFWWGVSAGVVALAHLFRDHKLPGLLWLLASTFVILAIRPNLGVVISYLLVASSVAIWGTRKGARSLKRMVPGLVLTLALVASFPASFQFLAGVEDVEERVAVVANGVALDGGGATTAFPESSLPQISSGAESCGDSADPDNGARDFFCDLGAYVSVLCDAVSRLPRLLVGPFVSEIGPEPVWLFASISAAHFLFLLATSVLYLLRREGRNWRSFSLISLGLSSLVVFATVMTNYGIVVRFRVVTEIFLLPTAAALLVGVARAFLDTRLAQKRSFSWPRGEHKPEKNSMTGGDQTGVG